MTKIYYPKGTCSRKMEIEVEDGIIKHLEVAGGCSGNIQGIIRLVEGRSVKEVADSLRGVRCGLKSTSCPDQLAKALKQALAQ